MAVKETPNATKRAAGKGAPKGAPGRASAGSTKPRAKAAPGAAASEAGEPKISAGATFRAAAGGAPLGLNNLFSWLGNMVEQFEEVAEKVNSSDIRKHGEFKVRGMGEKARGIYGVSVKMGLDGEPAMETFGNIHPTAKGAKVSDVREPLVDIFDEDGEVHVVAELPGVSEADIKVEAKGSVLKLRAEGEHRYAKDVDLPAAVKAKPVKKTYRNGLLELRFAKA